MEISVDNSQKSKNKSTTWPGFTTPWHMFKGLDIILHRYLVSHVHVHSQ